MPEAVQSTASPPGYLDGVAAEDAFQGLVDRGLLNDAPVAAPTPTEAAAPEAAATEPAEAAEPPVEEYHNLDEYLTKSKIDRESFLSLPVTVKVDGQESQVPLSALVRSYQLDAHVTQKSQALAESQRAWEAQEAQAKQVLTQQLQVTQQLGNLAHQQLLAEYQNIDWNKLRAEDPARWAVMDREFQIRATAIQQHLQQAQQVQSQQAQQQEAQRAQQLQAESAKMLEAFPEWKDPTKFQAARTELTSYAKQIGFNDAELAGIADHRYMKVLHDASRYAALKAKSPAVLKLVRAAPPMAAPGARMTRDPKSARLQQVREAARSGKLARNEEAQAAAFSALVDAGA